MGKEIFLGTDLNNRIKPSIQDRKYWEENGYMHLMVETKYSITLSKTEIKIDKKERLASIQHDIWSHWMKYQFSKCEEKDGSLIIPKELVERWKYQMNTKYSNLTEKEKDSDREQVSKFIHLI